MGQQIAYFAGPDDDRRLVEFGKSRGLDVVPLLASWAGPLEDAAAYPACYFSRVPRHSLHISDGTGVFLDVMDPLIEFTRAYYRPPSLIAGRVYWNNDNESLGQKTHPDFRSLGGWMRRNWRKRPEDGYFIGPEADSLLSGGAGVCYLTGGVVARSVGAEQEEARRRRTRR